MQPELTIRINYMLSQQSVIHINILFLSESYGTGIVYQDLFVEAGSLSRFKSALKKRFLIISVSVLNILRRPKN